MTEGVSNHMEFSEINRTNGSNNVPDIINCNNLNGNTSIVNNDDRDDTKEVNSVSESCIDDLHKQFLYLDR